MRSKRAQHQGREFWAIQVKAWRGSGRTQAEYCRGKKLNLRSLQSWSSRLTKELKKPPKASQRKSKGFLPLKLTGGAVLSGSGYELSLGSGQRLTIPLDCDVDHVASLVKALELSKC